MAKGTNISERIANIIKSKQTLNAKLVNLVIATETDDLEAMVTKADTALVNQGAISATVIEGQTYTIPKGYHNGSGTVTGLSDTAGDSEKYKLQSKTVTPTKEQINVTPDSGYYGLSDVTVNPIPVAYQDVTPVTAMAEYVLTGLIYVDKSGTAVAGTMANNGSVKSTITGLTAETSFYTIPKGYHDGTGTVSLTSDIEDLLASI